MEVLVIDDDLVTQLVVQEILVNYTVIEAYNPAEAMEILGRRDKLPDAVVLDNTFEGALEG